MLRKVFLSCLILLILSHLESIRVFAQNEELTLKEMCNQSTDIVVAKIVAKIVTTPLIKRMFLRMSH